MNHKLKLCVLFIILLAIMTAIFVFSSQPADKSKEVSDSLLDKLGKLLDFIPWFRSDAGHKIRKLAHFIEYMSLGAVSGLFFDELFSLKGGRQWRCAAVSLAVCFLYACSDEIHQIFVPGRSCELKDILLDSGGALAGNAAELLLVDLFGRKGGYTAHEDTSP